MIAVQAVCAAAPVFGCGLRMAGGRMRNTPSIPDRQSIRLSISPITQTISTINGRCRAESTKQDKRKGARDA
jgi:hypothetical protein